MAASGVFYLMASTTPNPTVSRNLARFRERLGLTQTALADYLGIRREEVSYYENGRRAVPSAVLSKAAALFCIHEYDFYEEEEAAQDVNIAFAFRAGCLSEMDLPSIADFKKIVRNYLDMNKALQDG